MPTSSVNLSLTRPGVSSASRSQPFTLQPSPAGAPWRRASRAENTSSSSNESAPPPPPMPSAPLGGGGPPPPPPPPPPQLDSVPEKRETPAHIAARLEALRKMPRRRPDWASMMKEIEVGKQLRKVQTNDRSRPILPQAKAKGKVLPGKPFTPLADDLAADGDTNTKEVFVYDSEKPTVANQILLDIQKGVKLKRVQCNDRSRPNLLGLGVFRRQLSTVETPSEPTTPLIEPEEDYDDIDKVRDDLQSTKQMLELEMKNKARADEENARLMAEIRKLKEELAKKPSGQSSYAGAAVTTSAPTSNFYNEKLAKSMSRLAMKAKKKAKKSSDSDEDDSDDDDDDDDSDMDFGELEAVEEELNNLRGQAELARKTAEEFEAKYKDTNQKLVTTQAEMEDLEIKVAVLNKKLKRAQAGGAPEEPETCEVAVQTDPMEPPTPPPPDYRKSYSKRDLRKQMSRQESKTSSVSQENNQADEEDDESSEADDDEEEEQDETTQALKEQKRELSLLNSKLRSLKDKEKNVRNERIALRLQMKKFRSDLKEEKKKYARLKKEVDGMAAVMNEVGDDEEVVVEEVEVTDDEEEEEEKEEVNEDNEEEESEEDEDDDIESVEDEESEEDTESDEMDDRIEKLGDRIHNHENVLGTLKKGNYLLRTRVDNAQEELRKERARYADLELELNNCLAELG